MPRGARGSGASDSRTWREFAQGAVFGSMLYMSLWALRIPKALGEFDHSWGMLIGAVLGGLGYMFRLRGILWTLGAMTAVVFGLASMTPLFARAARSFIARDELRKADAVVVLGSYVTRERRLDHVAFTRMVDGIRLVREGWAPVLIWTRVGGDARDPTRDVKELARVCGNPRMEVVGPVLSTRDEAMRVAELTHRRGWRRLILVTSPYHSLRAATVFRKLGLEIISYPSTEREFAPSNPRSMRERLEVFRWWLYEETRWLYYRARGWV